MLVPLYVFGGEGRGLGSLVPVFTRPWPSSCGTFRQLAERRKPLWSDNLCRGIRAELLPGTLTAPRCDTGAATAAGMMVTDRDCPALPSLRAPAEESAGPKATQLSRI